MNMDTRSRAIRYILPTITWSSLLEVIVRDAPSGSTIEVHTEEMRDYTLWTLAESGRSDVQVFLRHDPLQTTPTDQAA
jgi:hypothetical protein